MNRERIEYFCDNAMRVANYSLAFFLPISIALVESFFGLGLFFFLIKRGIIFGFQFPQLKKSSWIASGKCFLESVQLPKSNLRLPIGVFILIGLFSVIVSQYPLLSIKGFIFKLLEWTFVYFIFLECMTRKKYLKIFLFAFFASAILVVSSGYFQVFQWPDFIRGHSSLSGRVNSSFSHPNDLAAYLLIVTIVSLSMGLLSGGMSKNLRWNHFRLSFMMLLFFVLSTLILGFTYSRGAWFAFILELIVLGILCPKILKISLIIIAIFLLLFFQGLESVRSIVWRTDNSLEIVPETIKLKMEQEKLARAVSQETVNPTNASQDNQSFLNASQPTQRFFVHSFAATTLAKMKDFIIHFNSSGRQILWNDAFEIIRQHPFGIGLNNYSQIAREHNPFWSGYPHNCFLQMTAEMGFMGLFVFVWIMFRLFRHGFHAYYQIKDETLSAVLLGSLLGIFGFLIQSFFDTNFYSVQLGNLMWLFMGVVTVCQKLSTNDA